MYENKEDKAQSSCKCCGERQSSQIIGKDVILKNFMLIKFNKSNSQAWITKLVSYHLLCIHLRSPNIDQNDIHRHGIKRYCHL